MSTIDTLPKKEVDRVLLRLRHLLDDHGRTDRTRKARIERVKALRQRLETGYSSFLRDKHPSYSELLAMNDKELSEYKEYLWPVEPGTEVRFSDAPRRRKRRKIIVETTGPAQGFVAKCDDCGDVLEAEKISPVVISNAEEKLLCGRCTPKKPKVPRIETRVTSLKKFSSYG